MTPPASPPVFDTGLHRPHEHDVDGDGGVGQEVGDRGELAEHFLGAPFARGAPAAYELAGVAELRDERLGCDGVHDSKPVVTGERGDLASQLCESAALDLDELIAAHDVHDEPFHAAFGCPVVTGVEMLELLVELGLVEPANARHAAIVAGFLRCGVRRAGTIL
ncbi:MAG: hypothetical protein ACOC37_02185 [Spirochaetota bacterium]